MVWHSAFPHEYVSTECTTGYAWKGPDCKGHRTWHHRSGCRRGPHVAEVPGAVCRFFMSTFSQRNRSDCLAAEHQLQPYAMETLIGPGLASRDQDRSQN